MSTLAERRAAARYFCQLETACRSLQGMSNISYPGMIYNLSTGGLSMQTPRRFASGTLLMVRLENATRTLFYLKLVQVRHARAHAAGWEHGCTFPMKFSPEQLAALL